MSMLTPAPATTTSPVLRLAVPSPLRRLFDYLPPQAMPDDVARRLQPGIRIRVNFGNRELVGVLISVAQSSALPLSKLKPAMAVLDSEPILPPTMMRLFEWAVSYYQHPPGEVFMNMLPALLRRGDAPVHEAVLQWRLSEAGLQLTSDALKRAPRQREIVEFLREHGELDRESLTELGISAAALRTLEQGALVCTVARPAHEMAIASATTAESSHPLNAEQQAAVGSITSAAGFETLLLDGVTGSGKTEVYMQAIGQVLQQGRQAIVLVPEISLTPQTIQRFRKRFRCRIAVMHSRLTDSERLQAWLQTRDGIAPILIGTRSAIFTPQARPGIIIVDEEHDSSFKQQDGFRYSARDLAVVRARTEGIPVVLGSATPSLESLHNALSGRYRHLRLTRRAGDAERPRLRLLDTSMEPLQEGFSARLLQDMREHLARGNQVLVFINRRGFAPTLQCADCGWVAECSHCDARFTLHKTPPHLRCHHCDTRRPVDRHCPGCRSRHLQALGLGTERSEQFLAAAFPDVTVLRVDRDSTRRKDGFNVMLNEVHQGKPCILVGTQMLAKGHHFPAVTLVAVLDADGGLFSADFRGQEHTAQLLIQVAGRSGRAGLPGEVVIQTRHAAHPTLQALVTEGYEHFARSVLQERHVAEMPPFSFLALLRAEAADFYKVELFLEEARHCAEALLPADALGAQQTSVQLTSVQLPSGVRLLGPLPAPMERRAGRYRMQLQLQADQRKSLQLLLGRLAPTLEALRSARAVRWSIDVDPVDMI